MLLHIVEVAGVVFALCLFAGLAGGAWEVISIIKTEGWPHRTVPEITTHDSGTEIATNEAA
jgi:hypothetical protein